jgi:hypothetical protein
LHYIESTVNKPIYNVTHVTDLKVLEDRYSFLEKEISKLSDPSSKKYHEIYYEMEYLIQKIDTILLYKIKP